MTHEDAGHYSAKHSTDRELDPKIQMINYEEKNHDT
jgi:hypothetical protein